MKKKAFHLLARHGPIVQQTILKESIILLGSIVFIAYTKLNWLKLFYPPGERFFQFIPRIPPKTCVPSKAPAA
jgi:hypothetical protein